MSNIVLQSKYNADGDIEINIKIPRDDLWIFSHNQMEMLYLLNGNSIAGQLRIIFTMILEALTLVEGEKHG